MRTNVPRTLSHLPLAAFALTPVAPSAPAIRPQSFSAEKIPAPDVEAKASGLLEEIQPLAGQLTAEASTLQSLQRGAAITWQAHAFYLNNACEHLDSIGDRLDRLQAIRSTAAPWQLHAMDQIVPIAANVAAHAKSAIQYLSETPTRLFAPVYAGHVKSLSDLSAELKKSVDAYVAFGQALDQFDCVQHKLDRIQEGISLSES